MIEENKQNENKKKIICPNCKSSDVIKWTTRKTENRGIIQRYKCKDCGKTFTIDEGFFRMRNSPEKITCAVDLFYRGVSTRKVQEHFKAFYPHNASWVSVYSWVLKYAKMIHNFTSKLKVNVGSEIQVDEIEFHRRKNPKKKAGTEKNFFIDSVCPETKYMVSSEYSKTRGSKEIKAVVSRIKENAENPIKMITTDGWNAYENVIKGIFGYNRHIQKFNVFHNKVVVSAEEGNFNHPIERLHNSVRARTKTMRGFHGSVKSANSIMKGFEIYYNFITKHQAINCCPYELACPELKEQLNTNNKWLALIKVAQNIKR